MSAVADSVLENFPGQNSLLGMQEDRMFVANTPITAPPPSFKMATLESQNH